MPASPVSAKTGSTKIKPVGQTAGKHFGTNASVKQVGRSADPTGTQILGK